MLTRLVAGLDDAGRGPVIGPLVIAGVMVEERNIRQILNIGVRDSKLLSPMARSRMAREIARVAVKVEYAELSPAEIDDVVTKGKKLFKLNFLEAKAMAKVIDKLRPQVAYVDSSDVSPERFMKQILEQLSFQLDIISEHKADAKYPIVSAASIMAKVRRDELVESLKAQFGDFGSGYPSDPRTTQFLRNWVREKGEFPPFVRKSWKTLDRLKSAEQTKL